MYYDVINFHHEKCWNNGDQFGFFFLFFIKNVNIYTGSHKKSVQQT